MRKAFVCSLCHNGILGGGLYLAPQSVTYMCQKFTVDKKYKKLIMPLSEIKEVTWKWVVFPIAVFHMNDGEIYKFLVFNKWRIEKWFLEYRRKM